jgi:hypothetical protein
MTQEAETQEPEVDLSVSPGTHGALGTMRVIEHLTKRWEALGLNKVASVRNSIAMVNGDPILYRSDDMKGTETTPPVELRPAA